MPKETGHISDGYHTWDGAGPDATVERLLAWARE